MNLVFNGICLAALCVFLAWLFTGGVNALQTIVDQDSFFTLVKDEPQFTGSAATFIVFEFINLVISIVMLALLDRVRAGKSLVVMTAVLTTLSLVPFAIVLNAICYFYVLEARVVHQEDLFQRLDREKMQSNASSSSEQPKKLVDDFITFPDPVPPTARSTQSPATTKTTDSSDDSK